VRVSLIRSDYTIHVILAVHFEKRGSDSLRRALPIGSSRGDVCDLPGIANCIEIACRWSTDFTRSSRPVESPLGFRRLDDFMPDLLHFGPKNPSPSAILLFRAPVWSNSRSFELQIRLILLSSLLNFLHSNRNLNRIAKTSSQSLVFGH
jgi:hypothetical protein